MTGVYPHVCGAAGHSGFPSCNMQGLSPRVWGSLIVYVVDFRSPGSIPTCVGQPPTQYPVVLVFTVYPHVCGAAGHSAAIHPIHRGLSPRVWGSPAPPRRRRPRDRSIPTCVGQPTVQTVTCPKAKVYPHVCGAASNPSSAIACRLGLSPRVWGSRAGGGGQGVYPHVCGAARLSNWRAASPTGLSPRVWGSPW